MASIQNLSSKPTPFDSFFDEEKGLDEVAILDFETTGLSPQFERAIEVAIVVVKDFKIVDKYSQLMNPGHAIPSFITSLTGITNEMVFDKPSPEECMKKVLEIIGERPIVAHNASFDRKFLIHEIKRAGLGEFDNSFLCSLMLSRRLFPEVENHQLGTLVNHFDIECSGRAHRALADVEMTAGLWKHLYLKLCQNTGLKKPGLELFESISRKPKATAIRYMDKIRESRRAQL